jgi:hypothetical protein
MPELKVTDASPAAFVVVEGADRLPPPDAMVQFTVTPATPSPWSSATFTTNGLPSGASVFPF